MLKRFLQPAIWLAGRLNFRHKLLGAFLLFSLPLAGATALLLHGASQSIDRIVLQRQGLALQMPILGLVRSVQDHFAASLAAAHGDMALETRITASVREFEGAASSVLAHPLAGDDGGRIRRQWGELASRSFADADEVREAHERMLEELFRLREAIVDRSGLGLQDEISVQVATGILNDQLVPLVQNLGQARDTGTGFIARGRIGSSQRDALSMLRGSFDTLLTWMSKSVEKTGTIAPATGKTLAAPLDTLNLATLGLQEFLTTKLINTTEFDLPAADFHAKGSAALDAAMAFGATLVPGIDGLMAAAEARARTSFNASLIVFGASIVLIGWIFAGAYSSIIGSIGELERAVRSMTAGDLRTRVELRTRDEIGHVGDGFNTMARSFAELIGKVAAAAGDTQSAAGILTDQIGLVTTASGRQSETAASSSSSVQQLAVSVQEVAAHAEDTSRIVRQAADLSAEGRDVADRAKAEMQRVVEDISRAVDAVLALEERSRNVDQVVGVISEIADQTNLLALNAAIEAARAGELGRGFAVVADEVRKLADRTGKSTREIGGTIREMRAGIQDVVASIREGSDRVGASSASFSRVREALDSIHDEVSRSANFMSEIVDATRAQTEVSTDIARSIERMSAMADENHAAARHTGSIIDELQLLSGGLRHAVSGLRV
ncbi:MAG: methyl-accepting chemotaxis protein [Azoarcus sp.]|nr:methyl-accepting chemotaxis protein [Azoarcus sp.]